MYRPQISISRLLTPLGLAGLLAATAARAYDDGDWQLWLRLAASGNLVGKTNIQLEEETRMGDDMDEYAEQHLLGLLYYPLTDWLKVGGGTRTVFARTNRDIYTAKSSGGETTYTPVPDGDHYWRQEDRPTIDVTFAKTLAGWLIEDRNWLEYRMKEGEDDYFRYRNRLQVKAPWKWTRYAINPVVSVEPHYSDKDESPDWDRVWYTGGVDAKITKLINAGVYYRLQSDKLADGSHRDYNILGLMMSLKF